MVSSRTCRQPSAEAIQSRVILEAVLDREDHPTADQLFEDVRGRIPGVSRTTVYRVLETLVQLGVVRRANHSEAMARFDGNTEHHHHLVCLDCHCVTDLDDLKLGQIKLPDTQHGVEIADYSITSRVIVECRRKEDGSPSLKPAERKVTSIERQWWPVGVPLVLSVEPANLVRH